MRDALCGEFLAYHRDNPQVWELFKKFTMQLLQAGRRTFGANAIMERIRWHVAVETKADPFKVNNNYAPFYARKFMAHYPEYIGFFRRRQSAADRMYPALEGKVGQGELPGMEE